MSLNTSRGNMYTFVNYTWNTIKGKCAHGCSYCYLKRWGKQNPARFDFKELKTDLGTNNFIFVGSSNDVFAEDNPKEWITDTLNHCKKFDNTYLFQSKNPKRIGDFVNELPKKSVITTTIETNRWYGDIMDNSPHPKARALAMQDILLEKYVTIEPILDFDLDEMVELIKMCNPTQVNIGADSGGHKMPEPSKEKILDLIDRLKEFTKIDKKNNLKRLLK